LILVPFYIYLIKQPITTQQTGIGFAAIGLLKFFLPLIIIIFSMFLGNSIALRYYRATTKEHLLSIDVHMILDTSALIDGRILDICKVGFLKGKLVVPHFVLNELQYTADSSNSIKRSKGRRGLDILNSLTKLPDSTVIISKEDFDIKEVDGKIIELAKKINGELITTDFNLNKVATLQGIKVLNINDLANAMKPIVMSGEGLSVKVIKKGKDVHQGLAYLEDGTMIVIEKGAEQIGKVIDVDVTNILQTSAGRVIFASIKKDQTKRKMITESIPNDIKT
ncbi:PIN/TRAM domain-containing protein, partial [Candidatus Riflebacteria bacterium]